MKIKFTRPTIYMSHPIRGTTGDVEGNCKKASAAARRLRRVFPEVDFYVPAEHDLTLQILTLDKQLSVDDIMYADLQVLEACHGYMFYRFDDSVGSDIECDAAEQLGLTDYNYGHIFSYDIEKTNNSKLRKDFQPIVDKAIERFRRG